ncbi:MAG: MFS transporter [Pseudomonadota bacterium]|nr:MFS transporter [Pseudomonadota bacterium]
MSESNTEAMTVRGAIAPLAATSGIQIAASLTMFGVAVIAPVAAPDIGVDATLIGPFTAIAYGSGVVGGLLTGACCDRFGAIRVGQFTMILAFFGVALLVLSHPIAALLSAIVLGISYGPVNPFSTHILARVVPEPSRPLFLSIKQSAQPAGTAIAGLLLPFLVALYDWRLAMLTTGVIALAIAFAVQPLRPRIDLDRDPARTIRGGSILEPIGVIWREPRLRCLAVSGFILSGTQVSLASFFVVYLTETQELTLATAGGLFTIMQVGGVLGRTGWGGIADRFVPANLVMAGLCMGTAALCAVTAFCADQWSYFPLALLSFGLGATSHGWNGIYFSEIIKFAPLGTVGIAASGAQFATLSGVAFWPMIFGLIVATGGSYTIAFLMHAAATAVATVYIRAMLRDKTTLTVKDHQ